MIKIESLTMLYKNGRGVNNIEISVEDGEVKGLLGPNGVGKSTIFNLITGLIKPAYGSILFNGTDATEYPIYERTQKFKIGFCPQYGGFFSDLTLYENLKCVGEVLIIDERKRNEKINQLIAKFELESVRNIKAKLLSGGQRKKCVIALALLGEPQILLLDEPFSSVDAELRESLALDVRSILKELNVTSILVTHDQNEAFMVADDIGVMNNGHIEQWANAYNIYHKPETRFVADFVGLGVFVKGISEGGNIKTPVGIFKLPKSIKAGSQKEVELLIRPDDVIHNDFSKLSAIVEEKHFRGAEFLYKLKCHGVPLLCYAPSHHDHKIGEPIGIDIDLEHLVIFQN